MKKQMKKQYVKPVLIAQKKRFAAAHVCCGLMYKSTCSINYFRIS